MSLVFNLADFSGNSSGSGGSGGLSLENALIHVNAPLGSNVEFAKGGAAVETMLSSQAFPNADGETADYYYSISSTNYGTWTVTASFLGATLSNTVSVSAAEQYDVILADYYYIFRPGAHLPFTVSAQSNTQITIGDEQIAFALLGESYTGYSFGTTNLIDLTDYNTLCVDLDLSKAGSSQYPFYVGIKATTVIDYAYYAKGFGAWTSFVGAKKAVVTVDISSITGSARIVIDGAVTSGSINAIYLRN